MRQLARPGAAVATFAFLALPSLGSAEVQITHGGVDCVVAGQFPVIQATLQPADEVARARVYFHGSGGSDWYYVEMESEGGAVFQGVLPQPLASLDAVEYYIETLDPGFVQGRSQEFSASVISSADICPDGRTRATMLGSVPSAILLGVPEGATAVPTGFASVGLAGAAGGAGISTGLLLGIGGAAGAAAIAVGVTGGDDGSADSGSPTAPGGGTPAPTPTPTPAPMRDVTGRWAGTFNENPSAVRCTVETDLSFDLVQTGSAVSGSFQMVIRMATSAPGDPCPVGPGDVLNGPTSGVVNGDIITIELDLPGGGPSLILPGTVSDDRMSGTDPGGAGTWDVRRQ